VRSFRCAPWKGLRIFEENIGLFQDAHFRKLLRIFEQVAHLRSRAAALHTVPLMRKVAHPLASAFALVSRRFDSLRVHLYLSDKVEIGEAAPFQSKLPLLPQALEALGRCVPLGKGPHEKKEPCLEFGTAPRMRDLQLLAVPL
jgi:hypothetical protein